MKTYAPKAADVERRWYVVDADGAVLGRLASEVAKILRGKHKPIFAPHADTGDHVIVVNAGGVRLTGGKEQKKIYYRHSGYPGGLREIGYDRLLAERPVVAVEKAVRGMLPKNRLGRKMFTKLSVYEGAEHPHRAQQPRPLAIGEIPRWEGLPAPKPAPQPTPAAPKTKAPSRRPSGPAEGGAVAARSAKSGAARPRAAGAKAAGSKATPASRTQVKRATGSAGASSASKSEPAKKARSRARTAAPAKAGEKTREES